LSKVSPLVFFPSTSSHQILLKLNSFFISFHVLFPADVISTLTQEIRLAWSATLNPIENNEPMRMKNILGRGHTDKRKPPGLILVRSWLLFLVVIFIFYKCIMYPILFLELFINVNLIVPPLKISLNHWGCFCLMRACEGIIYNKSCGRWLIFLLIVFFFYPQHIGFEQIFL
jgi:hypothetical protein